jgi:hypothetical protein
MLLFVLLFGQIIYLESNEENTFKKLESSVDIWGLSMFG